MTTRVQAMEIARAIVEEHSKPQTKMPTLGEKVDAMVKLATFLWDSDDVTLKEAQQAVGGSDQ